MEYEVYVLKQDIFVFFEKITDKNKYASVKKLIDDMEVVNSEYINIKYAFTIFDYLYGDDELYDDYCEATSEFDKLTKYRFIKSYDQDMLTKKDVVEAFINFLEEEQISPEAPDYNVYMDIINSIPIARLEV